MKGKFLIGTALFAGLVGLQSAAWAGPSIVLVNDGTAVGSIQNGDKLFSNFFCHILTSVPISTPLSCAGLAVSPFVDPHTGNLGIEYGGSFSANSLLGAGIVDVRLTYDVSAPSALITDVHMNFDAGFSPTGTGAALNANVTETVFGTNPNNGQVAQITVSATNPPPIIVNNAFAVLPSGPYQSLFISKDVLLQAFTNPNATIPNGTVLFTTLDQTFSQVVPEPGTITLLGTALLGCAALFRRKLSKR
ncbi:MAG TPA: PEP-CTERM sorting domain-containing protein [Bryobacteraceae bacterium]|nr:PEP-CTERM sorting domain-containing protein [Bryobacteraceae bacterium]